MTDATEFSDAVIDRLHILWGDGFLSPGGSQEVSQIVAGIDLCGRRILDIGCGTAGPAIVLAGELGAGEVVGIDIEPRVLEHASRNVGQASLGGRISLKRVDPGPLPFSDDSFDIVFSKDSICHIADKESLFREIARLLRPEGIFAASDWLADERASAIPEFVRYIEWRELGLPLVTAAHMTEAMRRAGLKKVCVVDRSEYYVDLFRHDDAQIEGVLKSRLADKLGSEKLARWASGRHSCAEAVRCGGLRPSLLRAHSAKVS
jgi:phosphoethanolamine N-methyltransferase